MPRVLAFDLSLTSTGVAYENTTSRITPKSRGTERLAEIRDAVRNLILCHAPEVVAIEGYAYARANQAHQIGELGGVIRLLLRDMGYTVENEGLRIVAPSALKKWATGRGDASKERMLEVAIRKFAFEGHGNDEADAWLLYLMTLDALRPDAA